MSKIALYFPKGLWDQLVGFLLEDRSLETMAMGLFSISSWQKHKRLLVHTLKLPKESDYESRSPGAVGLSANFLERCLCQCEQQRSHLLDIHTHPWSEQVGFSGIDDREALATKLPYMMKYMPQTESAFLVMGKQQTAVDARVWDKRAAKLVAVPSVQII